jgi:L-threonylcarbamoyladenylate synthase
VNESAVDAAVAAVRAGDVVVVPTDTVYGLAATPYRKEAVHRLYRLKGRHDAAPTAIVAASVDLLLDCIPELRGHAAAIARALLPGPYTLVLPNPGRRFAWLCGSTPQAVGVRVPDLEGPGRRVLDGVGALAATSANSPGGRDPRRLEDVPLHFRSAAGAVVDAGELPGRPSTVLDFTAPEPRVLREGAVPGQDAIARAVAVLR